jgi:DNA processing protein
MNRIIQEGSLTPAKSLWYSQPSCFRTMGTLMEDAAKSYWVGFSLVPGNGAARLQALLGAFGDIEAAWRAARAQLARVGLPGPALEALLAARHRLDLDAELRRIEAAGYSVITWVQEDYPERLLEIPSPPPVLCCWGEMRPQDALAVAIVGPRRATPYDRPVAGDVAGCLAGCGVTVVSGLARGIDGWAHRAALAAGGRSMAVLGPGADHIYPPEHSGLARQIAENGAVITDYPLGTCPEAVNLPLRNRIISSLSLAAVIVAADNSSGASIAANFAADQGREVFAVPGNINSAASRGTNRLIRSGATPLPKPEDVLRALYLDPLFGTMEAEATLPKDEQEQKVYLGLSKAPLHIDEVQRRCGLSAG